MKRMRSAASMTLLLLAAAVGCNGDAPRAETTATSRALLAQPRPADVSTTIAPGQLGPGQPTLAIDLLGVNMGVDEAPMKVIEFVDYGCGFCRKFQIETFPTIRTEYIETNKIQWKFMPFISGMFKNSHAVTSAAECALDQDARLFGAFSGRLWVDQQEWKGSSDPAGMVRGWLADVGADMAAYDSCLQTGKREERVTSATALASQLGVRSTPTFWIVGAGPVQGALPIEAFRQVFDQIYAQMADSVGGA